MQVTPLGGEEREEVKGGRGGEGSDRSTDHTRALNMYLGERCHFSICFLSACQDGDGEVAPVVATPCQGQSESSLHKGALSCGALGVAGLVHWAWLVWCIGRGWSSALGVAGLVHWVWLVWCIGRGWSGALGVAGLVHWAWLVWCSHAKVVVSEVVCVEDKLLHSVGSCIK